MRLQTTPPKGAGKSQGVTKTERLLQIIEGLGQDKNTFLPLGIRTSDLAERAGVPRGSVQALLAPHVESGRLHCCKVTVPGSQQQNEYRKGAGVATPKFKPLNSKRAGIARNTAHLRPESSMPPAAVSQPAEKREPEVPVFLLKSSSSTTPQPEVGNTGSVQSDQTSADEHAVASREETPGPQPERRGMGPAPARAPAGDVLRMSIDQDGALQLGDEADPARWVFTPAQVLALGDFLHGTQGVWRP